MPFTNLDYCSFMMAGNRSFMTARPAIDTAKSFARPSLLRGQVHCADSARNVGGSRERPK